MTRAGRRRAWVTLLGLALALASCAGDAGPSLAPSMTESVEPVASVASGGPVVSVEPVASAASVEPVEYGRFPPLPTGPLPSDIEFELQGALDKAVAGNTTTAIAAAVIVPGSGTWAGAAGDGLDGEPLPVEAQFHIASITKTVIAAQVLQLAEQDRIELDGALADFLPPDMGIDTNGATVRQALSMRSGLADVSAALWVSVQREPARHWSVRDLAQFVEEPIFQPGQVFHYNNLDYILLGAAIAHVSGQPIGQVLRSGVLAHPGLDGLVFQDVVRPPRPMAPPTAFDGFRSARAAIDAGAGYLPSRAIVTALGGAGAMSSDAPTLARWAYLLYGGSVLEPASLAAMIDTDHRYGLGTLPLEENGLHGIGHDGWFAGYRSLAYADRETGTIVVVLVNAETHAPIATAAQLLRIVGD